MELLRTHKDAECTVTVSITSGTACWCLAAVPAIIFVVTDVTFLNDT